MATTTVVTTSLADRDEFGLVGPAAGLFQAPLATSGLDAREDLGHALCAWLPREDLL
ncbi:hypothetical protein [Solirubrobacter pauli]|nr:hypothetical protein [Solirubrobacter pauli]